MLSSQTKFPMPIETDRLVLQPPSLKTTNIDSYCEAIRESINELRPWLPWAKFIPTRAIVENYVTICEGNWITKKDNNIGLPLWILNKNNGEFLGNIVMWNIDWKIPKFEFGYWIRSSQTKKGYAKEAVKALASYCLKIGVNRIEIRCEKENIAAQMVPKSLGFNLDGILPKSTRAVANNELTDTVLFSLTDIGKLRC